MATRQGGASCKSVAKVATILYHAPLRHKPRCLTNLHCKMHVQIIHIWLTTVTSISHNADRLRKEH